MLSVKVVKLGDLLAEGGSQLVRQETPASRTKVGRQLWALLPFLLAFLLSTVQVHILSVTGYRIDPLILISGGYLHSLSNLATI